MGKYVINSREDIELRIIAILDNPKNKRTYSLVFSDKTNNPRRFSMIIGKSEAESIVLKIRGLVTPRPLTYDLMTTVLYELNALLEKVVIYKMKANVFYSYLYLLNDKNEQIVVDARTSDAVALAMCVNAPIFITADVMDIVGEYVADALIDVELGYKGLEEIKDIPENQLEKMSKKTLLRFLEIAVEKENFEIAVQLRDAIEKRETDTNNF